MGHRPAPRAATSRCSRSIRAQDMRGEMLAVMGEMGMKVEKHHHEVAPAQHELGLKFDTLIAHGRPACSSISTASTTSPSAYGKTATFMAKPMFGDNGSGMHVHQSIWKDGKPLFAGDKYADLSPGMPLVHRRHHQARQGDQRLHQLDHQLLQAPGARATKPRCCWPTRPATARPPAASRGRRRRRPSASKSASPTRWATPTWPSRPC